MIVRGFFPGVNLNVLAVSSLVVGYIVGNATQDTLGNLFAGLALNAERPFHIGDWVLVAGHTGIVVDTTWRATRLKTKAEDYIVLPNAAVAKEPIINYSRPTRVHGCYLSVGVSYETPPGKARETILAVLAEIPDVARDPAPSVYLTSYGDFSINFTIKCFIQDFERLNPIESQVMERLWYGFRRAGISIPFPIRDVRMRDAGEMDRAAGAAEREHIRGLLSGVDLFQTLSAAEFGQLVQGTRAVMFGRGEVLCRQGDTGAAFYVIQSGRVAVSVAGADGVPVTVAQLGPSAFFGEMALLTGEPRSATITADGDVTVLEVSKDLFAGFLRADAALAEKLGVVLEKRVADRQAKVATGAGAAVVPARVALVARIRKFFGLG
jgi:CRP-like cAMP-binding protein